MIDHFISPNDPRKGCFHIRSDFDLYIFTVTSIKAIYWRIVNINDICGVIIVVAVACGPLSRGSFKTLTTNLCQGGGQGRSIRCILSMASVGKYHASVNCQCGECK